MPNFDDEFIQYSEEKIKSEKKTTAFSLAIQIILYILLIFFAIFFIWYTAFVSTHKYYLVVGASMKDSLNSSLSLVDSSGEQDAVYVNTIVKQKMFDIVVVKRKVYNAEKKTWETKNVVKRVMGLEGDYISIALHDDGTGPKLYFYRIAKGTKLDRETFEDESARLDESSGENGYKIYSYDEWTESKDITTFLGEGSADIEGLDQTYYEKIFFQTFLEEHLQEITSGSEDFFVSKSGMVYVKIPKGEFFCMGDNRGHSGDCRENGFYKTSNIVGTAEIIIYNHNFGRRLVKVVDYYFSQVQKFFAR